MNKLKKKEKERENNEEESIRKENDLYIKLEEKKKKIAKERKE